MPDLCRGLNLLILLQFTFLLFINLSFSQTRTAWSRFEIELNLRYQIKIVGNNLLI
jgi:hypothetical protein